jgi:hypothetical protein
MAFMKPVYYECTYAVVETEGGDSYIVPDFVCDSEDAADYADFAPEGLGLREKPETVEFHKGVVTRLSASGYMDCTDWEAFDTYEEARAHWEEEGLNPDNGNDLDEEEEEG